MSDKRPCVYILASKRNGTLYIGVTSDIARLRGNIVRMLSPDSSGITGCIGWYLSSSRDHGRCHPTRKADRIKKWRRAWKLELIERDYPQWRDLYDELA